jgi:hypothetical protein
MPIAEKLGGPMSQFMLPISLFLSAMFLVPHTAHSRIIGTGSPVVAYLIAGWYSSIGCTVGHTIYQFKNPGGGIVYVKTDGNEYHGLIYEFHDQNDNLIGAYQSGAFDSCTVNLLRSGVVNGGILDKSPVFNPYYNTDGDISCQSSEPTACRFTVYYQGGSAILAYGAQTATSFIPKSNTGFWPFLYLVSGPKTKPIPPNPAVEPSYFVSVPVTDSVSMVPAPYPERRR